MNDNIPEHSSPPTYLCPFCGGARGMAVAFKNGLDIFCKCGVCDGKGTVDEATLRKFSTLKDVRWREET